MQCLMLLHISAYHLVKGTNDITLISIFLLLYLHFTNTAPELSTGEHGCHGVPQLLPLFSRDDVHHVVEVLVPVPDPFPPIDEVVKVFDEDPPHQVEVVYHQGLNAAHVTLESHYPLVSCPETLFIIIHASWQ